MNRDTVLRKLHEHRAEMSTRFGARRIALFGSAARDELSPDSDVDVLVDFEPSPTFERYCGLQDYLEELMGRRVDLVTQRGLKPRAWQTVRQDLIDVT
jgi:predicted nucleotidyltransferase